MQTTHSVWSNFSQKNFLWICFFFQNSLLTVGMRGSYSVWCNDSRKKSYIPVDSPTSSFTEAMLQRICTQKKVLKTCHFSYFSFYRGHASAILCVMRIFSKIISTDLFFFLIQHLQRTCERHTQCDAFFLENISYRPVLFPNSVLAEDIRPCNNSGKKLTYLFFLLLQFLQRTCQQDTQCDAIFLRSTFYRPVLFHISVLTVDMRGPQFLQRTSERHTQSYAIFLKRNFYRPVLFSNSVPTEDMRRPWSMWCNKTWKKPFRPDVSPTSIFTEDKLKPYSVWCNFSQKYFL